MQVQIAAGDAQTRPAMRMWEWFDYWAFDRIATQTLAEMAHTLPFEPDIPASILAEGSRGAKRMARKRAAMAKAESGRGSDQAQHNWYMNQIDDLTVHHGRMTKEQSKARLAHVDQWRKDVLGHSDEDIKRQPSLLKHDGHDMKSAAAAKAILQNIHKGSKPGSRDIRHKFVRKYFPDDVPESPKTQDKAAHARHKAELDWIFQKHAFTRPGEDVSPTTTKQHKAVHRRLERRQKFIDDRVRKSLEQAEAEAAKKGAQLSAKKKAAIKRAAGELDVNHPLNIAAIAQKTGVAEHEVRSIHDRKQSRAKAFMTPIRELGRVAKKIDGPITHDRMGALLSTIMKNIHKTSAQSKKMDFLRGAVAKGGAEAKGHEGTGRTALDIAQHIPGQTRAAERAPKRQARMRIHHPKSDAGKADVGSASDSDDGHHELIGHLNKALANRKKKEGKDPAKGLMGKRSSVDVKDAIDLLYHHGGHDTEDIAKKLNITSAQVERHLDPKTGGGGGMSPAATSGKRAGQSPRDLLATPEKELERQEKGKARRPSHAVLRDLQHLYPRRGSLKDTGQDTALGRALLKDKVDAHNKEFADKVHALYHGEKTKGGQTLSIPKPHQKDLPRKEKDKAPDWDDRKDPRDKAEIFGSPTGQRAGFGGLGRGGKKSPLEHPSTGVDVEKLSPEQRKKHQAKLDKFHDLLADKHEGVHKAMTHIVKNMTNPNHPHTKAWYDHHNRLNAAIESGNHDTIEFLKKEGAKKNIHSDLLRHHMNHAADDVNVQKALGVDGHVKSRHRAASALTNIVGRIQSHGKHWMATAHAHGLSQEKLKAHQSEKGKKGKWRDEPASAEPRKVKVPQARSKAGGIIGAKGHHEPEQFEPEKPEKRAERAKIARGVRTRDAAERERGELRSGKPSETLRDRVQRELAAHRAKRTGYKTTTAAQTPGTSGMPERAKLSTPVGPAPAGASIGMSGGAVGIPRRGRRKQEQPKPAAPAPHPHQSVIDKYHAAKRDYDSLKGRDGAHMRRRRARQALAISHRELASRGLDPHNLPGSRQGSQRAERGRPGEQGGTFERGEGGNIRQTPEEQGRQAAERRRQALVLSRGRRKKAEREERQARREQQGARLKGGQVASPGRARRQRVPFAQRPARPAFEALLVRKKLVVNEGKEQSLLARLGLA